MVYYGCWPRHGRRLRDGGPRRRECNRCHRPQPGRRGGLEGWTEALQPKVAPFGIHTTIVNPGFFRTELLTQESTTYAEPSIADYAERHAARQAWYEAQNGQQSGDPAKLAQALIMIAGQDPPPRRFIAGADAIAIVEQKVEELQEQINAYRDLSTSLARDAVKDAEDRR